MNFFFVRTIHSIYHTYKLFMYGLDYVYFFLDTCIHTHILILYVLYLEGVVYNNIIIFIMICEFYKSK